MPRLRDCLGGQDQIRIRMRIKIRMDAMKYRILGRSGLRVSVIGMGTWQFGGEWGKTFEQSEVTAMFRRAMELGINFIDTAECYGDHLSEKLIGQAITDLGAGTREKFLLATKFGHHFVAN